MRQDLSAEQWHTVEAGQLTAPSGITYRRRTTRMERREATTLVESGCPVVTYWPGGLPATTQVIWHDGTDARAAWESARGEVTSETPRPPRRGAVATAGRWESAAGDELVLLTWHH